jgi:hypothetical protein
MAPAIILREAWLPAAAALMTLVLAWVLAPRKADP